MGAHLRKPSVRVRLSVRVAAAAEPMGEIGFAHSLIICPIKGGKLLLEPVDGRGRTVTPPCKYEYRVDQLGKPSAYGLNVLKEQS